MKSKVVQILSALAFAMILIGAAPQPGFASAPKVLAVLGQAAAQPLEPTDPRELEAFVDDFVAAQLDEHHIPGITVSVVKDGELLFAKGYGDADLEGEVPVDPERTLFRIGSVSKLFTWTAIMQLLEQGKLSLDTDVNEYLDFSIPDTYPEPITLRRLLSHTPGFEDQDLTFYKLQAEQVSTLDAYLEANLPTRIFPPGEVAAYSNYGAALAGYIVERVSGLPFDEYAERYIFAPLGMAHSTFRQPLPEDLSAALAKGYNYTRGQFVASSFVFDVAYPGGSMSTTATDMARFMIAHLQEGELDGQRILQKETAVQMHSQLYTPDPRLNAAMAHGFLESIVNGQRILWHTGSLITHLSGLYLIPDQNLGLFISTNSTGGAEAVTTIDDALLDRYYPMLESPNLQSAPGFAGRITPYLGEYAQARGNFSSFEGMARFMAPVKVRLDGEDTLVLSLPGRVIRLVEAEPGVLRETGDAGNAQLVYRTGPDGRRFLMNGVFALFKVPWYGTVMLHWVVFGTSTLLFLVALIAWPIGYIAGRRKRGPASPRAPWSARLARWTAALFGLLWLGSLFGIVSIFVNILPGFGVAGIQFGTPWHLPILLSLSYVLIGLALAMLVFAVLAWLRRHWSLGGRAFYSLLVLVALVQCWSLLYWNLLP